jgi:hypothetical protein
MLLPAPLVRDYTAIFVMLTIAGAALGLAAAQFLVAQARGVGGADVGKYWLRIFPILCLLASTAVWISRCRSEP